MLGIPGTSWCRLVSALMVTVVTLMPSVALTQEDNGEERPASTFAELVARGLIKQGDKVQLTIGGPGGDGVSYRELEFVALDAEAITVVSGGDQVRVPEYQVLRIVHAPKDTVWKGGLIGLGVGAALTVPGLVGGCDGSEDCYYAAVGALVILPLSFGIGVWVDHMISSTDVVYEAPAIAAFGMPKPNKWSLTPTFKKKGYGALFTFEFGR